MPFPQTARRPGVAEERDAVRDALRKEAISAVGHQLDVGRREVEQRQTIDMILVAGLISATVMAGVGAIRFPPLRRTR